MASHFNPIYWNTACLIVNSGVLSGQTDYSKIAKAIGEIRSNNISISLTDINQSSLSFKPDVNNNTILYGLKAISGLGDEIINKIIQKRPYVSLMDFIEKVEPSSTAMIALIKSGAFDKFDDRKKIMVQYIWYKSDKKKNLTLANIPMLLNADLIPTNLNEYIAIYEFNRYLKAECKFNSEFYMIDDRALDFIIKNDWDNYLTNNLLSIKLWDKIYQKKMDVIRNWLAENKNNLLEKLNIQIFLEEWNKYATGSISSWELESLCFYYHEHELQNVNTYKYGISSFKNLPTEPIVEKTFKKGDYIIPLYKIVKICGTCIAKNKNKNIVYLLTTDGVVPVKFRSEYFSLFDKQLSQRQSDGSKKVIEKSWFKKGSMIMVQGIRRGDDFIVKKYASTNGHQLYKIVSVDKNGDLELKRERTKIIDAIMEEDNGQN